MGNRGLGHDFDLCHAGRPLTNARADTIGACVSATDDQHFSAFRIYLPVFGKSFSFNDSVLSAQQFKSEMDSFQLASRNGQIPGCFRSGTDAIGIEIGSATLWSEFMRVDLGSHSEFNAFRFQELHPAVDNDFIQFEIGDSVAK